MRSSSTLYDLNLFFTGGERGGPPREVNSKFIGWVRSRWTRFQAGLGHSTEPPPHDARAGNPVSKYSRCWRCPASNVSTRWAGYPNLEYFGATRVSFKPHGTGKFLQHVKHQWRWDQGRQHEGNQGGGGSGKKASHKGPRHRRHPQQHRLGRLNTTTSRRLLNRSTKCSPCSG